MLGLDEKPDLLFEATSAYVTGTRAALCRGRHPAIDLTPAAVGPAVIPPATFVSISTPERQHDHLRRPGHSDRLRRVRVVDVPYAESWHRCFSFCGAGHSRQHRRVHQDHQQGRGDHRRRQARQGDHHPQPRRPANDHARHHLLRDPGGRRPRRDRAVHPATSSPRCRRTCPATGCSTSPSSTTRRSTPAVSARSPPSSRSRAPGTTCRRMRETWTS